jgi:hypothetical protein
VIVIVRCDDCGRSFASAWGRRLRLCPMCSHARYGQVWQARRPGKPRCSQREGELEPAAQTVWSAGCLADVQDFIRNHARR